MEAAARPWTPVVLAMIGSVCGTLITDALDTTPTVRLIGAVLGAAIPTLVTYAGSYSHLRASVGIAVTAVALFVTYGGFTLVDFATDQPKTFPLPPAVPEPDEEESSASTEMSQGGIGIKVTPEVLRCSSDACEQPVTIKSTGEKSLRVTTIELEGEAASSFRHGGECENQSLLKDEDCSLNVSFASSGTGGNERARLIIHQNLPSPPTYVDLEGEGGAEKPIGDLVASPIGVACIHQGAVDARDVVKIYFFLQLVGANPNSLPGGVLVTGRSNIGHFVSYRSRVSDQEKSVASLLVWPGSYGRTGSVFVRLDPKNQVREDNEDNNQLRVSVPLPERPARTQALDCAASQQ